MTGDNAAAGTVRPAMHEESWQIQATGRKVRLHAGPEGTLSRSRRAVPAGAAAESSAPERGGYPA